MSEPIPQQPGWQPPEPDELARLLPQYRIESLIGCGGMAAVYRGTQVNLDRPIAIKLLPAEVAADGQFVERFRREACILANLQHPGIVTVYESGQTGEGHLFFVMEFVDGTDLHHILRDSGLNASQALAFTSQVCDALQYAHDQGVIHSDIKPGNILITRDGRAKLADFGLARPTDPARASASQDHTVMGTPDYAAPEQHDGLADPRSDLFALGVVLYEMLTGQTPQGAFDPPSRLVPVDVRLDDVVAKALQSDPAHRFQRASVMKAAVDRIRTSPIQRHRTSEVQKAPRNTGAFLAGIGIPIFIAAVCYFNFGNGKGFLTHRPPSRDSTTQTTGDNSDAGASNNILTSEEAADGWILLFNGKNLDGWKGLDFWTVQDQAITGKTTAAHPAEWSTCLIWQGASEDLGPGIPEEFKRGAPMDFELKFQCKIQHGDSAVLFRSPGITPAIMAVSGGYGMLIQDYTGKTGSLVEYLRSYPEVKRGQKAVLADDKDPKKPKLKMKEPLGTEEDLASVIGLDDWNNCRIVAVGNHVQLFVNDRQTVDLIDDTTTNSAAKAGQIAFQIDKSSQTIVQYKNVKLRKCEPAPVENPEKKKPVKPAQDVSVFTNSLGMKFARVPNVEVLFCIWETRVRDYEEFAQSNSKVDKSWKSPELEGQPVNREANDPVVSVSWHEANAFCQWLTDKEISEKKLPKNATYRLPTDLEWSAAADLEKEAGDTPKERYANRQEDVFPWGEQFPPKEASGNFADVTMKKAFPNKWKTMDNYDDKFATTSPVGSFPSNRFGIFDLSGNVWEWCAELLDPGPDGRAQPGKGQLVLRGGSYADGGRSLLCSSARMPLSPDSRASNAGFRCILTYKPLPPKLVLPDTAVPTPWKPADPIPAPSPLAPTTPSDLRGRWRLDGRPVVLTPSGRIEDPARPNIAIGFWRCENAIPPRFKYAITWNGKTDTYYSESGKELERKVKRGFAKVGERVP